MVASSRTCFIRKVTSGPKALYYKNREAQRRGRFAPTGRAVIDQKGRLPSRH